MSNPVEENKKEPTKADKMGSIIALIVAFGVGFLVIWGLDRQQYQARCWQVADEHYVLDGQRYAKQFPVKCSSLKDAKEVAESYCYYDSVDEAKSDGFNTFHVKTYTGCPDEE